MLFIHFRLTESFQSEKVLTILPTCIFSGENAPPLPSHPSLKVGTPPHTHTYRHMLYMSCDCHVVIM